MTEDSETADADSAGQDPPPEPRQRKAWTPEADDETAAVLRRLAVKPWLVGGRDDEQLAAVRRNEAAVRSVLNRLGWVLVVERDLVRLRKSPPPRSVAWAAGGPAPLTCSWFFLLVAAGESVAPRVGIGQLVTAARAAAAEAALPVTGDIFERRAIVAALHELEERGVIEPVEGDLDGYVRDEQVAVLLAVHHTRLAHVVANPGTTDPSANPELWLAQAHQESDPARRMRRRLIDDTCVHSVDLDEAEAQWLSQRVRGDDGAPLAAAFGVTLERRSEGAAFVVPEAAFRYPRDLGPMPFPIPGTVAHAALLLCDDAAVNARADAGPGTGWRTMSGRDVLDSLAVSARDNRGTWKAELADDIPLLARSVADVLQGLNLMRFGPVTDGMDQEADWCFSPVTGRWARPGTAASRERWQGRRTTPAGRRKAEETPEAAFDLFDGNG